MGILLFSVLIPLLTTVSCVRGVIFTEIEQTGIPAAALEKTLTLTPTETESPTEIPDKKSQGNDQLGLSFSYPTGWLGPEECTAYQELRV